MPDHRYASCLHRKYFIRGMKSVQAWPPLLGAQEYAALTQKRGLEVEVYSRRSGVDPLHALTKLYRIMLCGQLVVLFTCAGSIAGCVALALNGFEMVAGAVALIPMLTVVGVTFLKD
jgi:hypothetical protein